LIEEIFRLQEAGAASIIKTMLYVYFYEPAWQEAQAGKNKNICAVK